MKRVSFLIVLAFAAICLSACSNMFAGTSDDPNQVTASIKGVVEKGPFVKGTTVTLYELNPETFAQTGKVFTGSVDGDDGSFSLGKVELGSHYALVEASGYYWNELYGMKTTNPLSLKAVVHIEKNSTININVGTHITHKRILSLVESGVDFDKAKAQAEAELTEAFFGEKSGLEFDDASIFDDEKLLALSVLMLMAGPEPDVTEMIASLAAGVTDDLLVKLADKAALRYNDYAYARKNMEKQFPNATVGHFEKYVYGFWQRVYGLGECSKENSGALDTIRAEKSANDGKVVICKEIISESEVYVWRIASDMEEYTAYLEPVEDGKLVFSEVDSSVAYVYVDSSWREATEIEKRIGYACVRATRGSVVTGITGINNGTGNEYVCALLDSTKLYWKEAWIRDYPKEMFFNPNVEYGSVTDDRDGHVYKTVEIDGKTWMAENLAYVVAGIKCDDSLTLGCDYTFEKALSIADGDTVLEDKRGLCMEGWHIPDTTEWRALVNAHAVTDLLSERGWIVGSNGTGFSVVPTDYETGAGIIKAYPRAGMADFATSSTGFSDNSSCIVMCSEPHLFGYSVAFANSNFEIAGFSERRYSNGYDYARAAIRCVKDSE